jgi:beta-phosphoglucomutase-like phosphatase (HAD superfamily)
MALLPIPEGLFKAYLFDMDGTVADTMPLHYVAWSTAVQEAGGTFPEDLFYSWAGIPLIRTVEMLNEKFGYKMVQTVTFPFLSFFLFFPSPSTSFFPTLLIFYCLCYPYCPHLSFCSLQVPADVVHRKENMYLDMIDRVTPVASVVAHVHAMHGKIPLAIVSGSPRASIIRTLTTLGLLDFFDTLVGSEDYTHGKPHPEPFLTAAKRYLNSLS